MQFIFDSYKILKMRKYEFYKLDVFTDKLFADMNRPSRIYAEIDGEKGNVNKVKIGGNSVIVAKGEMYLD